MSLYTLPNATEPDNILVQLVAQVPAIIPLVLAFVFFVVFLGGIARQKARTGTADYAMWSVVASLSMFMVSLILSVIEGLIHLDYLVIVVIVTIFSAIWLFFDKRGGEL